MSDWNSFQASANWKGNAVVGTTMTSSDVPTTSKTMTSRRPARLLRLCHFGCLLLAVAYPVVAFSASKAARTTIARKPSLSSERGGFLQKQQPSSSVFRPSGGSSRPSSSLINVASSWIYTDDADTAASPSPPAPAVVAIRGGEGVSLFSRFQQHQRQRDMYDDIIPDVRKVLSVAVPAIGVWMCMPLLSMIDTSSVGLLAGTAQQAALNPAIAVISYSARLLSFLYTGTTTLVAAAQEADRGDATKPKTTKTLIGALQLSLFVGVGLGAVLAIFSKQLLFGIAGKSLVDPAVVEPAIRYIRIRAFAMPAAAVLGAVQTACLAMKDGKSPVYVTAVAAAVNYAANMLLIRSSNPLLGGAAGAAWATALALYAAVTGSIYWLVSDPLARRSDGHMSESKSTVDSYRWLRLGTAHFKRGRRGSSAAVAAAAAATAAGKTKEFTTRGFLSGRFRVRDLFRLPCTETSKGFAPYVVPVTATQVGRCSASATIDHVVSSSLGTVSMAANQIITSIFYGMVPLADSLSLAAQSFVPGIAEKEPSEQKARALGKMQTSFLKAAGLCGAVLAGTIAIMPMGCKLFTADPAVIQAVTALVPIHFIISSVHGVFCASEGFLLGHKDLGFLGKMYAVYSIVIPWMLLRIKNAALQGSSWASLSAVWKVFLGYNIFRSAVMVSRILYLQRKAGRSKNYGNQYAVQGNA